MFRLILCLLGVGVCACGREAPAEPPGSPVNPRLTGTPLMRVWFAEDYGAAPVNWRVAVHPSGLVYVANNEGVLEWDGARWRLLPLPRQGPARGLAVDARGRVWASGDDEVCVFAPDARGELRAISQSDRLPAAERAFGTANRIVATADAVFMRSPRRLIAFFEDGRVDIHPAESRAGMIWTMDGVLHAESEDGGLLRLAGREFAPVPLGEKAAAAGPYLRVFAARREGSDWVFATARGPACWAGPGHTVESLAPASREPFRTEQAGAAAFLSDGRMVFGTVRSGLVVMGRDGRVQQRIDHAQGLPGNRINDVVEDAEGGVWIALQGGIARVQLDSPLARHGAAQGFEGSPRMLARAGDRLYVAHSEGVSRRDPATGRFVSLEGFQVGANRLLVVGEHTFASSTGLRELRPDHRVVSWSRALLSPLTGLHGHPGCVLAGAVDGLWIFAPKAEEDGWRLLGRVTSLPDGVGVDELHDSGDGFAWLATPAGRVWRLDFRGGVRLDPPVREFGTAEGLPLARRRDNVQLFQLGNTPVASSGAWLLRFDAGAQRFQPETRIAGLPDTARFGANTLHAAPDGTFWLQLRGPERELYHVLGDGDDRWRAEPVAIEPVRGLPTNSLYEERATRTLWFAGQGALVSLDLAWKPTRPRPPLRALVRRVETAAGEVIFGGASARSLVAQPPTLNPGQAALRFAFAAPTHLADYQGHGQTLYRTRLDGFDRDWTAWSREAQRDFTNLPYRAFAFRVQARALDGRESAETTFAFAIAPPWWRAPWALALEVLIAVALVAAVARYYSQRALRRRVLVLEAHAAVEAERLRLARDLHDDLGSGLGRVALLGSSAVAKLDDRVAVEASFRKITETAQTLSRATRDIIWAVNPHNDTAADLVAHLARLAEETLAESGIRCAVDVAPDVPATAVGAGARHAVLLALKEALHNAIKYAEAKTAEFSARVAGGGLVLTLRDHGRGFAAGECRGTGHGLKSIGWRLEAHGGSGEVASVPGAGTTVTLKLPLPT